jgi:hypothetical protein
LCRSHDLGSRLAVWVRDRTLRMAVVRLVLGMSRFSMSWRSRSSRSMIR